MSGQLTALQQEGTLSVVDVEFAQTVCSLAGESRDEIRLSCAVACHAAFDGHVCADLTALCRSGLFTAEGRPSGVALPPFDEWCRILHSSPVCSDGTSVSPLVLDDGGRLYLERNFRAQQRLAAMIRERVTGTKTGLPDDPAERAVSLSRDARFLVITGGPGTGKSTLVARLLKDLPADALSRVRLVAPTGKAAVRLQEAMGHGAMPVSTIHRALGIRPERTASPLFCADNPLPAEVLIVDEASMVDLHLMVQLLAAVPSRCRVILVGDRDQLASVEAGAVLRDICGDDGPLANPSLAASIVSLTRNWRFPADSPIGRLAASINRGDGADVIAQLAAGADDVRWICPDSDGQAGALLAPVLEKGFLPLLAADATDAQLDALDRFRVLCAVRRGPWGLERVGALAADMAARRGRRDLSPVMVVKNDYGAELFNGDTGVRRRDANGDRVVLRDVKGKVRDIAASALPPHEPAWAVTVHKAQGSEFDHVVIVLPSTPSPVLSRELLYTAVTRARRRITIVGKRDIIAHCVNTPTARASGLRDLLWNG